MSQRIIVDIADMKASDSADASIVTYALGSCIGVAVYDPVVKAGAMLHYMLPDSQLDERKARENPHMFADTGVIQMFKALESLGCAGKRLIIKAAGGSNIMDPNNTFNIGKKNHLALKKILWRYNLIVKNEDVGGSVTRNMTLDLATGRVFLKYAGRPEEVPL